MPFLSIHPGHDTRATMISDMVKDLDVPDLRPRDIDWDDIQARVAADAGTGIAETANDDAHGEAEPEE